MGVTGDFADLDAAIAALDALASDDYLVDVATAGAERIQGAARANYAAGRGPFGEAWAPRKADGAPALQRPAAAVEFVPTGTRIVGVAEPLLDYHQAPQPRASGYTLPTRRIFPAEGEGLPPVWRGGLEAVAGEEFAKRLKAAGAKE
jgi:hypothetical protein